MITILLRKIKNKIGKVFLNIYKLYHKKKAFSNTGINSSTVIKSSPVRIAHIAHYRGNWGDLVLNAAIERVWNSCYSGLKWKRIEVRGKFESKEVKHLNSFDGILVGGGGLFLPDSNLNSISGWQWAITNDLLNEINTSMAIFAVGYNYFRGQEPSDQFVNSLETLIQKADFIGLRNNGSIKAIKSILSNYSTAYLKKIKLQPCPTTFIEQLWQLPDNNNISKTVGINVPFDRRERRYGSKELEIINGIVQGCLSLSKKGYKIKVISHTGGDIEFAELLRKESVPFSHLFFNQMPFFESINQYRQLDLVIGGRGHAQMIPFGLGVPILSLDVHDKLGYFLDDIDRKNWLIKLEGNTKEISELILSKSLDMLNNKRKAQQDIREIQQRLMIVTRENIKEIHDIFMSAKEK